MSKLLVFVSFASQLIKKQRVPFFGLLILIITGVSVSAGLQTQNQQPNKKDNEAKELTDAIRRGGLREAARRKGRFVLKIDPSWDWATFDLESLTKSSTAVVTGEVVDSKPQLDPGGEVLTTEFQVVVGEPIKGNFRQGNTIQVAMLGGSIEFGDGTSAEVQTPGFDRMAKSKKYLLFLTSNTNGSAVLLPTGGPQGVFEINGSETKNLGRSSDAVNKQTRDKDPHSLIEQVREYVAKWPSPEGCCR